MIYWESKRANQVGAWRKRDEQGGRQSNTKKMERDTGNGGHQNGRGKIAVRAVGDLDL